MLRALPIRLPFLAFLEPLPLPSYNCHNIRKWLLQVPYKLKMGMQTRYYRINQPKKNNHVARDAATGYALSREEEKFAAV